MTERIGTRELRADLAAHVRRAGAGQRVVITSSGRAVATLGPVDTSVGATPTLDALVAAGLVLPPRRVAAPVLADPVPIWSGVRLDRALREVRG
jgi:prevent-host-death family protein